jgi:hypothetical protein
MSWSIKLRSQIWWGVVVATNEGRRSTLAGLNMTERALPASVLRLKPPSLRPPNVVEFHEILHNRDSWFDLSQPIIINVWGDTLNL